MRTLRLSLALLLVLAVGNVALTQSLDPAVAKPPLAKKVPKVTTIHGERLIDHYHWLRDKKDPEVIAHLEAENAYTAAVMKPTEKFQETLYKEILGRIKQTDLTVPYRLGDYWYYTRTEEGKQYNIHCRKKGNLDAPEQVLLDLNELAKGHKFLGLGAFAVSDDGRLLAYSLDVTGFRDYTAHVKDLDSGKVLPDRLRKVTDVVWAADNKTLFYVTEDEAKRPCRLHRHVLGNEQDQLLYEEKDGLYNLEARRSRDKAYVFALSESSNTCEVRYLPGDRPNDDWRVVLPREDGHRYYVDHRDGLFYLRTNKDAKNFRVVTAPVADPGPKNWKEFIAHRPEVKVEDLDLFEHYGVIAERANALPGFTIHDFKSGEKHRMDFPEPIYSVNGAANPEFKTGTFRYHYQSLITSQTVYDYDLVKRKSRLLKQKEVLGGYDPKQYAMERVWAVASDGVKVPLSIISKKGTPRDGAAPLLLYGYGAYGAPMPASFQSNRLSLLDRGVIFAIAHIRGGGDLGETWHDQGKMLQKRNSFTDFIACADHLIAEKYTRRDRLVIQGGSAGGLLMGGVLTLRPDVAKAAVLQVPFVDVINTMLDTSLPLTVQEFLEWGNPQIKKEYDYLKSYCPYTNLKAQKYPALLLTTSLNDSQVMYFEPAKYTAKLRSLTNDNLVLLKINMAGGHGGSSGRYDKLREDAFVYAFVLRQMGIEK
jgi:oligopeptidase B